MSEKYEIPADAIISDDCSLAPIAQDELEGSMFVEGERALVFTEMRTLLVDTTRCDVNALSERFGKNAVQIIEENDLNDLKKPVMSAQQRASELLKEVRKMHGDLDAGT
ncbi:MAG: hypothetical protein ABII07_00240 [Patescibacteria group bacterium]|nr:hypothetical protein [Patescibacteria group bacterium]